VGRSSGAPIFAPIVGHEKEITLFEFSPDGGQMVSDSWYDQEVRLWDTSSGEEVLSMQGHTSRVISVAFSPNGTRIASGHLTKRYVCGMRL